MSTLTMEIGLVAILAVLMVVQKPIGQRLSVMMFLQFFVWGAWFVTLANYMGAHGMDSKIYWAYEVVPIAAIVSPFFLGLVADRYFAAERILAVLHVVGGALLLVVPSVGQQGAGILVLLLLLHALCYMPTLGLTNTLAFHSMTDQEKQFPLIRVFGTIGWIAANFVVSRLFHGDNDPIQFYVAGGAALVLGIYSLTLPHTPPAAAGTKASARDILGLDALQLMKQRPFAVFIVCSFLICIPLAGYYSYAARFVEQIHIPDPAFHMSFGQMSEFFFMLLMPVFFARLGVKWMLVAGMGAWVLRYAMFSAAAENHMMWLVLGGILLHGICYDFFFVTGQIYVDKKASNAIRGQAQGFLVLVTQGLGPVIGQFAMGQIVTNYTGAGDARDWHSIWMIPAAFAGVVMVIFFLLFKEDTRSGDARKDAEVERKPVGSEGDLEHQF